MAEFTLNKNLYKWKATDTKLETINETANNAEKLDVILTEQAQSLTTVEQTSAQALTNSQSATNTANNALTKSDEALTNSKNAVTTAQNAENNAIEALSIVQINKTEVDNLILHNGESDAEIIQSRVKADGTLFPLLKDRLNQVDTELAQKAQQINVKDYGAIGDGLTDDTVAIQNAIDECSKVANSTLYFPTGTYLVRSHETDLMGWDGQGTFNTSIKIVCGLVWKGINQTWAGDGANQSVIRLVATDYSNDSNVGTVGSLVVLESKDDQADHLIGNMTILGLTLDGNFDNNTNVTRISDEGKCFNGYSKRNRFNIGKLSAYECKFIAPYKEGVHGMFSGEFYGCEFEHGAPTAINLTMDGTYVIVDTCTFTTERSLTETLGKQSFTIRNSIVTTDDYITFCNDGTTFVAENTKFTCNTPDKLLFYNRCESQTFNNCDIYYNTSSTGGNQLPFSGTTKTIINDCNFYNKGSVFLIGDINGVNRINNSYMYKYNTTNSTYENVIPFNSYIGNFGSATGILNGFPKLISPTKTTSFKTTNTWAADSYKVSKYLPLYLIFKMDTDATISAGGFWGNSAIASDEIVDCQVIGGNQYCIAIKKSAVPYSSGYTLLAAYIRCNVATNGTSWLSTRPDGILLN